MRASETGGSPVERSRAAKEADDTHATLPPPMTGPQHERSTSERYDAVSQGADMEMGGDSSSPSKNTYSQGGSGGAQQTTQRAGTNKPKHKIPKQNNP